MLWPRAEASECEWGLAQALLRGKREREKALKVRCARSRSDRAVRCARSRSAPHDARLSHARSRSQRHQRSDRAAFLVSALSLS